MAAFLVTAAQSQAFAEQWVDCTLTNNTGITISELYFQATADPEWGSSILPSPLWNGYYIEASYLSGGTYSFRIVFEDGSAFELDNVVLEGQTEISFSFDENGDLRVNWQ